MTVMNNRLNGILAALWVSLVLPGCPVESEIEYVAEVESNTDWILTYEEQTFEGTGHDFVFLPPNAPINSGQYELPVCVAVQKQTTYGYVRVRVVTEGLSILGANDGEWISATGNFGAVTACSDND